MDSSRPLATVRMALEKAQTDVTAALRQWQEELERRLQASENQMWAAQRELQGLEGYLSRVAAILGVDVGRDPDWSTVVAAADAAAERRRALEAENAQMQRRLQEAQAVARRFEGHAAALARVSARLGVATTDSAELLRRIDAIRGG